MTNVPESFCLLPWIHAHVGAQGQRKLCCIDETAQWGSALAAAPVQTLDEYWNSEEVRSVRRQMLGGTLPERCSNCSPAGNRALSYKDDMLARWPDEIGRAIASTAADGSTDLKPITFDYRSSTCNLRCRTCGPHSSTSAEIEARRSDRLQQLGEEAQKWDAAYLGRRSAAMENARDDLMKAAGEGRIRHLYWAGGEPLMDETHWEVMGELVRSGEAAQCRCRLQHQPHRVLLPRPQASRISGRISRACSCRRRSTASGRQANTSGPASRPKSSPAICKPCLSWRAGIDRIGVMLDLTLTSVGLLHLGDFLLFAQERDVSVTAKLMVPRKINRYMAVEFLPERRCRGLVQRNGWCG